MSGIVKAEEGGIIAQAQMLDVALRAASQLKNARGLLPEALKSEGEIVAVLLAGAELGLPPMASLRGLQVVRGKVIVSYDTMIALLRRAGYRIEWLSGTATKATLRLTAPDSTQHEETWDAERAKKAGLWGNKGPWSQYPETMLKARCVSSAARAFAGDVLAGVYVEGEIDRPMATVRGFEPRGEVVEAMGEIVDPSTGEVHPAPAAAPESLRDCATLEQLRAFVAKQSGPLRKSSTGRKKVSDRLHELMDGAPPHEIEAALCMLEDAAAIKLERRQPAVEFDDKGRKLRDDEDHDDMSDADQALYDAVHADIGDK